MNDNNSEFILFEITRNLGCDMHGKYFIQSTGNLEAIEKFKKINNIQKYNIKFFNRKYTWNEIQMLMSMSDLWRYDGSYDNLEYFVLKGKLSIPGEDKIYNEKELDDWWNKYLDDPKFPKWENVCENPIDLQKINKKK